MSCDDSKFYLREATYKDKDLLFVWANDALVRKSAFSSQIIEYDEHCAWFKSIMSDSRVYQYIMEKDGIPVGQIRVNINGEEGEIDYSIAPEYRLRGYGKIIVEKLIKQIKEDRIEVTRLSASVKAENTASKKIFLDNGFESLFERFEVQVEQWQEKQYCSDFRGGVLFLTNNENTLNLFDWLRERVDCHIYSDYIYVEQLEKAKPEIVISYNYNFLISREAIEYMHGNIINMHISYLPWNRGFSPNIWSFLEDTPKGVTIHKLSEELDKGEIIYQEQVEFDVEKETLKTTYDFLNCCIVSLFKKHFEDLMIGNYSFKIQDGEGTYHSMKHLSELQSRMPFSWNDNVAEVVDRYKRL